MKLNLPILSLDIRDTLSYQKCLMPKDKFPADARPGQWAKCFFHELLVEETYYAVAQVFPKEDLDEVCYSDTCVSNYNDVADRQLILQEIELLNSPKEITSVDIILQLDPEFYIRNSNLLKKSYLHEFSKIMLQKYHITHGSLIKDKYLLLNGIDSIQIEIENNCYNCAYITDNTNVNIKHISLKREDFHSDLISLNAEPFLQARQELENLIKFKRLRQCFKKCTLNLSLNAVIVGAAGCGKTTLIEEIMRNYRCNVFYIKITNILKQYPGETEGELRKIFKAATDFENNYKTKEPTVILFEEVDLIFSHPTSPQTSQINRSEALTNYMRICTQLLSLIDGLFTSGYNIMCLATTSTPEKIDEAIRRPGRFENEISIPALQENHRSDILRQLLKKTIPKFNIKPEILETLAKQTPGYVLADLALLVRNIAQTILTKPNENVEDMITGILKKTKPISLTGTDVTTYRASEKLVSIGGMFELKKALEVSILAGLKHEQSFKRFGLTLPKGVLLYGPPGCAKTTIAKCLAAEANMTFIATSGAEVYSPYVGCAEKFLAKIFQTARKNAPCLIFLDEIDSLVGRRSLTGSPNSGEVQIRILSTLLTEMDGIITSVDQSAHIMVVAATNRPDMVDDALIRPGRFDKLIHVPAPDLLSRRSILDLYKLKMPFSKSLDLDYLAAQTKNYSGADICNLCNEAAIQAFQRDFDSKEIIMRDFENALKVSKSSLVQNQIDWYYKFQNKFL